MGVIDDAVLSTVAAAIELANAEIEYIVAETRTRLSRAVGAGRGTLPLCGERFVICAGVWCGVLCAVCCVQCGVRSVAASHR